MLQIIVMKSHWKVDILTPVLVRLSRNTSQTQRIRDLGVCDWKLTSDSHSKLRLALTPLSNLFFPIDLDEVAWYSRKSEDSTPSLLLTKCVTLGKLFNPCDPPFTHLYYSDTSSDLTGFSWRQNDATELSTVPGTHSELSVPVGFFSFSLTSLHLAGAQCLLSHRFHRNHEALLLVSNSCCILWKMNPSEALLLICKEESEILVTIQLVPESPFEGTLEDPGQMDGYGFRCVK